MAGYRVGLPGGQARRLAIAQAYLRRPWLLLLDEPTEGLDREPARTVLDNLRSALPRATIIAAIHDRTLDHFPMPADITIQLAAGRVLHVTSPHRVSHPRRERPGPSRSRVHRLGIREPG